jgi:hypothetical protein
VHDDLAAAGYKGEWETSADGLQPVVTIEVIAPTEADARRTTQKLIQVLDQEVKDRQADYKLPAGENITTVTLDDGATIETVSSKLKRALVVVAGVGLIFTVMLAVGVDAILRRRARNRVLRAEAKAAALQARLEGRVRAMNGTATAAGTLIRSAQAQIDESEQTRPVALLGAPAAATKRDLEGKESKPSPRPSPDHNAAVTTTIITSPTAGNGAPSTGDGVTGSGSGPGRRTEPEDATIVLPLSNAPWSANAGPGRNASTNEAKKH